MSTIVAVSKISVSEARATLPDVLSRVEKGEDVTITRHGVPIAVVVRPDKLRSRRTSKIFEMAEAIGKGLEEGRRRPLDIRPGRGLAPGKAEEWVAEIRAGRDARPY